MRRRELLKTMAAVPVFAMWPRWSVSGAGPQGRDRLIHVYLRGGADGLTLCPPVGDYRYYDLRPTLAISESDALPLDARFGLHPAAGGLKTLFDAGELAIVHACGLATAQRSHFEAQSATEQGIDAHDAGVGTGWLGRYLNLLDPDAPLAGVALASAVPRSMSGSGAALAMASVDAFGLAVDADLRAVLSALYGTDAALEPTANAVFSAADTIGPIQAIDPGAGYPPGALGRALADAARLVKGDAGLAVAAINFGGWDHHENQAARMTPLATELGNALVAFRDDIGVEWASTVVLVQTEFGRRAGENASGGTDHGHGGVLLAAGGGVNGGRVVGEWPGLAAAELSAGEDLAVTTDYRQVLAELLAQRLAVADASSLLGGWQPAPWQGIFLPRAE